MVAEKAEYLVESKVEWLVDLKDDHLARTRVAKTDAWMEQKWVGAMGVLKVERMASQLELNMVVMMVESTEF